MSDIECPYCGTDIDIDHDDGYGYEEDKLHQQECSNCDRMFVYTTSTHYYYEAEKADCLNGGEHKYKLTVTYPVEYSRMRCVDCGEEISVKKYNELKHIPETIPQT
jgi:DNA-directed RNA polymerase subunit RPC12/RpoP